VLGPARDPVVASLPDHTSLRAVASKYFVLLYILPECARVRAS